MCSSEHQKSSPEVLWRRSNPRAFQARAIPPGRPRRNSVSAGPAPAIRAGRRRRPLGRGAAGARPDGGGRESGTPEKGWKCCWCGGCRAPHGWPGTLPQVGGGAPHPGACIGGRGGTPCGEPIIMAGGIPCAGIIRPSGMRYIIWYPGGGAPGGPSGAGGRIALRVRSNQCYFSALDESFRECRPVISRPRERKKKRNTRIRPRARRRFAVGDPLRKMAPRTPTGDHVGDDEDAPLLRSRTSARPNAAVWMSVSMVVAGALVLAMGAAPSVLTTCDERW